MSPALPVVSGRDVIKALGKVGFVEVSRKGSHVKLHNDPARTVTVPLHRELARGMLASILRQAGMARDAFIELL